MNEAIYPEAFVLEQIPQEGVRHEGSRCPATYPLATEISLYLEYTGQSYGYEDMGGWRCDVAFTLVNVITGNAYRSGAYTQTREGAARAFDAMGFSYRRYESNPARGDYLAYGEMKRAIMHSIAREKRPVIVRSLPDVFFGGLVVGYEQGGDVLVVWHYPAFDFRKGLEPAAARCGKWYRAETSLIVIDGRSAVPAAEELYAEGLRQAYRHGVERNGSLIADLDEWIRYLKMDKAGCVAEAKRTLHIPGSWDVLTFDNVTDDVILKALTSVADPLWCDYAERRYYAANFMRQAGKYYPEHREEMKAAAGLYLPIDQAMHKYDKLSGHEHERDTVNEAVFWDPEVRRQLAEIVEDVRGKELEIAARTKAMLEGMGIGG